MSAARFAVVCVLAIGSAPALADDPTADELDQMGQAAAKAGNFDQAKSDYEQAYQLDKKPERMMRVAIAYAYDGDFPKATDKLMEWFRDEKKVITPPPYDDSFDQAVLLKDAYDRVIARKDAEIAALKQHTYVIEEDVNKLKGQLKDLQDQLKQARLNAVRNPP